MMLFPWYNALHIEYLGIIRRRDPHNRHQSVVKKLVGKNGEWVRFPMLPEDAARIMATAQELDHAPKELDMADFTAFVPKGYCWLQGIDSANTTTSDTKADATSKHYNPGDEDYTDFDSRKFGPVS
jgi:hypothetical protein